MRLVIGCPIKAKIIACYLSISSSVALNTVKPKYFDLEEQVAHFDTDAANKIMRWWLNKLDSITGPLRMMSLAGFQSDITAKHAIKEEIIELD